MSPQLCPRREDGKPWILRLFFKAAFSFLSSYITVCIVLVSFYITVKYIVIRQIILGLEYYIKKVY